MSKEIKEILEALKPQDEEFTKAGIKEYPLALSIKEQKTLLDYITNLQEENKRLEENPLRGMFANITDDKLLIDMGYTNKENEELKQRINKAIEKLENMKNIKGGSNSIILQAVKEVEETISILRGEDNE